jgi:hypothetical protein
MPHRHFYGLGHRPANMGLCSQTQHASGGFCSIAFGKSICVLSELVPYIMPWLLAYVCHASYLSYLVCVPMCYLTNM